MGYYQHIYISIIELFLRCGSLMALQMLWPQLLLLLVCKMFLNYLLYLGKSSVIYQELVHNETMSHNYLSMSTVSFRRKAACPATVFTKDVSKTSNFLQMLVGTCTFQHS